MREQGCLRDRYWDAATGRLRSNLDLMTCRSMKGASRAVTRRSRKPTLKTHDLPSSVRVGHASLARSLDEVRTELKRAAMPRDRKYW